MGSNGRLGRVFELDRHRSSQRRYIYEIRRRTPSASRPSSLLVGAVEFSEAFKFSSRGTQGEIPRRYVACVEVLMRPEFGRHNDGDEDPRIHKEFEEGLAKVGASCAMGALDPRCTERAAA
jgi:hypothetical protein